MRNQKREPQQVVRWRGKEEGQKGPGGRLIRQEEWREEKLGRDKVEKLASQVSASGIKQGLQQPAHMANCP